MKTEDMWKRKVKKFSLKKTYYLMLVICIGIPIFTVFAAALLILNIQFKQKAVENIRQMQQTLITQLDSDVDNLSLRMTSMIYANNYEVMEYAAGTDTDDVKEKTENRNQLDRVENLYLEPNKEVISLYFRMKDGTDTYMKSYIKDGTKRFADTVWYRNAFQHPNKVYIGCYDTNASGELFLGGKKDMLVLIGVLSPDVNTDSSRKVRMVEFYQSSKIADQIKANNREYIAGKNRLGLARITDGSGKVIFSVTEKQKFEKKGITCIRTPVKIYDDTWYIENYVESKLLTEEFWQISMVLLIVMLVLFLLIVYYSRYFVRSIVEPIEEVNAGLRKVEDGKLDVHIEPGGQFEIRNMIHQFNAMVRRLRQLFQQYEEKLAEGKNSTYYFHELMRGRMSPLSVEEEHPAFFQDAYVLIGIYVYGRDAGKENGMLIRSFEKHARYASRCISSQEEEHYIYLFYRVMEQEYEESLYRMTQELQLMAEKELSMQLFFSVGERCEGAQMFKTALEKLRQSMELRYLVIPNEKNCLRSMKRESKEYILSQVEEYALLADAVLQADEKNMIAQRDMIFEKFRTVDLETVRLECCSIIIAIGQRAVRDGDSLSHIFGQRHDYIEKLDRIMDARSIRMWMTNFLNWILDYVASRLDVRENDMVVMAKRYIADQYENPALTLKDVADHVGLNEKYFSGRFTKEAGETVSEYLTDVRIQKAKELLRTTNFKIYEIAEMVGYQTAEHFNRMFKKKMQMSPSAFRKENKKE